MKTIKIATISALFVSFIILFVYAFVTHKSLSKSENKINELTEQVQKAEETYTILSEIHDRQNRVICDYQKELKRLQNEQSKKISIIEKSEDACDWLDTPVPESVRMLLRTESNSRNSGNEAACNTSDSM